MQRQTQIAEDDKQDLHDILIEETTRGQERPKKALSLARQRVIRRVGPIACGSQLRQDNFSGSY